MRLAFRQSTAIWSVARDAIVHKIGMIRLGIGHPRRCCVTRSTILATEWRMVAWTHNGLRLASVMAGRAGLADNRWIIVVEMGGEEGCRGVAVAAIV